MEFSDNTYPLPGWLLRIAEISNGHFMVSLTDEKKRSVELTGADAELPIKVQECIAWAKKTKAADRTRNDDSR